MEERLSAQLLEVLVSEKLASKEQINSVLKSTPWEASTHKEIEQLIASGIINENQVANLLAGLYSLPIMDVTHIDPDAMSSLSFELVVEHQCLPFRVQKNAVIIAIADPCRTEALQAFLALWEQPIGFVLTTFTNLRDSISRASQDTSNQSQNPLRSAQPSTKSFEKTNTAAHAGLTQTAKRISARESVSNIFNEILTYAITKGASDIHIEPDPKTIKVRMRIEGTLVEVFHIPTELKEQLNSRIKILASLDIAERRIPQDGRLQFSNGKSEYNFRLNTMPSIYGETVALRVLRPENAFLKLSEIGFTQEQLTIVNKGINAASGMILITGPTGCGKTTTLYSALSEIKNGTEKIVTVEDPVEYNLDGITQVQVNNETGLGFATILKALLRQDPDIILVGEIRDSETATTAVQAALSGHLVLSTLHTHDAPGAILRLLNMGIEPFLVLTSVTTVIAQRLVRKICLGCRTEVSIPEEIMTMLGEDRVHIRNPRFFRGKGCEKCLGLGFKGRAAVYEVLELNEAVKESILKGENPITFKRKAMDAGMKSLRQSALRLALDGVTSLEEALATTVER